MGNKWGVRIMKKLTKLQYFRKYKKGITVAELSKQTGIAVNTLTKYETGLLDLNNASITNVKRIAKVLGCTLEDLTDTLEEIDKGLSSYGENCNIEIKT